MNNSDPLTQELLALEALDDSDIDTSEIPERIDFSQGLRGRFFHLTARDYDVRAIGNWCIQRAREQAKEVSNLWLNKIVYFIYEEAINVHNVLLTNAKVEAWDHGPVFREIYFGSKFEANDELLRKFDPDTKKKVAAEESFSPSDLAIFNDVWSELSHLSASALRRKSHEKGGAWYQVWNYKGNSNPGMLIDIGTIIGAKDHRTSRNR